MSQRYITIERTIIYILSLIAFIGVIDTSFLISLISPYARKLGASEFEAGLIAGTYSIVAIPASIFAGIIMDRIGRWRLLRIGLTLDFISMLLYYIAFNPLSLLIVRIIHAIGGSMLFPSGIALVARYGRERLAPGVSIFLIFIALSVVSGSLTSASIVSVFGFKPVFLLLAAIIGIGGLLSAVIPSYLEVPEMTGRRLNFRDLIAYRENVLASISLIFTLYVSFGFIVGGYPSLMETILEISEERASALLGMYIGISTLVSIPVMYITGYLIQRGFLKGVSLAGLSSLIFSMLLIYIDISLYNHILSSIILGIAIGFLMVSSTFYAVDVDDSLRGVTSSLHQTFNILGVAVGAPLSGLLVTYLSKTMFIIPMILSLICSILIILAVRRESTTT